MPQDALAQGGNVLGGVGVQLPAPRNAAHQGTPTISGVMPVYNAATDPTINDGVNLGIYPGTRWINSATKIVFENLDNTIGAAIWRPLPRTWQSGVSASLTATTSETVLGTVVVPGAALGASGRLEVVAYWGCSNSGNSKTGRIRWNGVAGSIADESAQTTLFSFPRHVDIQNRGSVSSQLLGANSGGGGWAPVGGAYTTASINTAVDVSLVFTGQLAQTTDSITLNGYNVTLWRPDIGPTA